jgi:hypothetical protein
MQQEELLDDVLTDFLLLGAVRLHAQWRVYALTLGEWTLDYPAYDPSWESLSKEDKRAFRGELSRVDENNADEFCAAIQAYEVPLEVLQHWVEQEGNASIRLTMLVDFDERRFVHGYTEPVEPKSNYIPAAWTGVVGDPLDYVSEKLRRIWLS